MKYAIIETGGKQYKVSQGDTILVEKLGVEKGASIHLEKVLFVNNEGKVQVGRPYLSGSKVLCEVLGEAKGEKVINFKYRRRKGYRKKKGHRQQLTQLKVKEVQFKT
ncbi:MAG: 50S ribosomal protein L21 [Candidatus Omnitrophica bacterium]|nr:50S ribosomal protein L21 [Candidatus Omnitrophota bacterium]